MQIDAREGHGDEDEDRNRQKRSARQRANWGSIRPTMMLIAKPWVAYRPIRARARIRNDISARRLRGTCMRRDANASVGFGARTGATISALACAVSSHIPNGVVGTSLREVRMRTDVIVLGAGIIGVSTALHLQRRGRDVVLVDRRRRRRGGELRQCRPDGTRHDRALCLPARSRFAGQITGSTAPRKSATRSPSCPGSPPGWRATGGIHRRAATRRRPARLRPLIERCVEEHADLVAEAGCRPADAPQGLDQGGAQPGHGSTRKPRRPSASPVITGSAMICLTGPG